jgi:FKBP-type peptidyl-prolyl cis-trans isomerase FklB
MKSLLMATMIGCFAIAAAMAQEDVKPKEKTAAPPRKSEAGPRTEKERMGYVIGLETGRRLRAQGLDQRIDLTSLAQGMKDAMAGADPALSEKEIDDTFSAIQTFVQKSRQEMAKNLAKKNQEEGTRFLAANAKKEGVKSTKSGLQYKVLKEGDGAIPKATDLVRTHYHGTFINGEVFDSSIRRGEPAVFPVNGVIAGWTEALQLMKVGSKWQLFVPPDLAYGAMGSGDIPPSATLIFEVELLGIEKQASRSE